jgi:hypothetical protein
MRRKWAMGSLLVPPEVSVRACASILQATGRRLQAKEEAKAEVLLPVACSLWPDVYPIKISFDKAQDRVHIN